MESAWNLTTQQVGFQASFGVTSLGGGGGVSTLVVASYSSYYTMYLVVLLQEIEAGNAYLAITDINLLISLHGMQNSKYFKDGTYDRKRMLLYKSVLFCKALFWHFLFEYFGGGCTPVFRWFYELFHGNIGFL